MDGVKKQIPGYYYDEAKKKYFKIESSHTAPAGAAWSADSVKRRKVEVSRKAAEGRRLHRLRNHIRRSGVLAHPLIGGLLHRESGAPKWAWSDVPATAWARNLEERGEVRFVPSFAAPEDQGNLPCLFVNGDDDWTGLGIAYTTLDEESLLGSYLPINDAGRIDFSPRRLSLDQRLSIRAEAIMCPQMSSIKYHRPSGMMLLTSRKPDISCGVTLIKPTVPYDANHANMPLWRLGRAQHHQLVSIRNKSRDDWCSHQTTPAPSGASNLICVIGTNAGILQLYRNEKLSWLTQPDQAKGNKSLSSSLGSTPVPAEILDQDFLPGQPDVLVAGGRQGFLFVLDQRGRVEGSHIPLGSPVTHLRAVNEHQVLVAGLRSKMGLYDLRFPKAQSHGSSPVVQFPDYRNEAHLQIGWDVDPVTGVVAAAHDDGKVALYSLRTGIRLRSRVVDAVHVSGPVKSLVFEKMPRMMMPSLFMGLGPCVRKFDIGTDGDEM